MACLPQSSAKYNVSGAFELAVTGGNYVTVYGKTNRLARLFLLLCYLLRRTKMLPSKFEANPTLCRLVKHASFSLSLASSCSNTYFREHSIFYFLADRLVFLNTVTYKHYDIHA